MTGLRARLTAALVLLSVLTLAITAVSLLAPLDRQLREDALTSLEQTATTAKPGFEDLPAAAFHAGSPALDRATEDLSRRTRAEIIVVDSQGRVLSATSLDPGERFADATAAIRSGRTISGTAGTTEEEDEDEAQVAVPFKVDGRPLALAVRKSLDDISSTQEVVRSALLVAALLALAVAVVAGAILASRLVRRLTALRDTALRVAELGPVAEVQPDTTRDEIGDLTRAFATMQQRLREQEQARRTFIATASHELRTPLASLRLMLHGARDELQAPQPDVTDAREQVDLALAQSERLGKLAAELLDLSRLDAGLPLRSELVELGEVARSVIAEFDPRAAARWDRPARRSTGVGGRRSRQRCADPAHPARPRAPPRACRVAHRHRRGRRRRRPVHGRQRQRVRHRCCGRGAIFRRFDARDGAARRFRPRAGDRAGAGTSHGRRPRPRSCG